MTQSAMSAAEQDFRALLKEMALLENAISLLDWDGHTYMPSAEGTQRAELVGYFNQRHFQLETGSKMTALLNLFEADGSLLTVDGQAIYRRVKRNYERTAKLPEAEFVAYTKLLSQAQNVWLSARKHQQFAEFLPYLKQIVTAKKRFISYWKTDEATAYDVLLDQFEPGMTVAKLDPLFSELQSGIERINAEIVRPGQQPNDQFMHRYVDQTTQHHLSEAIVQELGFDFTKGSLDISMHPFTIGMNRNDVRITTRYDDHDFQMSLLGSIHEAGHALYEQNVVAKWDNTPLAGGTSMGIHESQSLFNEVFLGRNPAFWQHTYPRFRELTGEIFSDIDLDTFVRGFNVTRPSLIRTEADPLTYPLHIIIRYELEKAIFNEDLDLDELPMLWAKKYQQYLGITPDNDVEGVLQDIHWAGGDMGYFPSYALGHLYAGQIFHAMQEELDVETLLANGDFQPLIDWRVQRIHQFGGSKEPNDLILAATGEPLSAKYWLAYQRTVYERVYQY
ncbi:carboxypeptidase M32 [Furfurilactobacillus siliginis]|uniref:Metal-dependent carboxypeptidase n=1 Tax=Furfurilactobacillus siliginis TaxID=348151 RepID=A0A0R2L5F8_9LACO|nr:carboxypeptidase M32 [Furfurilactobacillus siliginis]KRN96958.1 thermostable carboxypeptidase 1 [Furfurilactobacillus siliginis]GEK27717.1 carboxypeptidase M32 [Furfurilactobacillus siliginis]